MGKFCQISAELLPLLYVEHWFWCLILGIIRSIFFKLCMWVDIMKECYWVAYHLMFSWPLIWKYSEILYTISRSRQLQFSFHLSYGPWFMHCLCNENISCCGLFACRAFICHIILFLKLPFSKYFFQEHYQSVKQYGSRSEPTECRLWFGSKLFAKPLRLSGDDKNGC